MTLVGKHNIAKMYSATTGTGTLTLTTAVPGFNTFALAGVVTGERVRYTIRDRNNTEVGKGIYTLSGLTLTRATILSSTNGGSAISCSGNQVVEISLPAEDISPFASYTYSFIDTFSNSTTDNVLSLDTESIDQAGLASVAANDITFAEKGWYVVYATVYISGASAFNGKVKVHFNKLAENIYRGYTTAMGILEDNIAIGPGLIQVNADGDTLGGFTLDNSLGESIDAGFVEVTILRVGNK